MKKCDSKKVKNVPKKVDEVSKKVDKDSNWDKMMKKGLLGCSLSSQVIVIGIAYCVSIFFFAVHFTHLCNGYPLTTKANFAISKVIHQIAGFLVPSFYNLCCAFSLYSRQITPENLHCIRSIDVRIFHVNIQFIVFNPRHFR